jgi:PAS domain S-box-containing protein
MNSPVGILYLEDDVADAELAQDTLEMGGLACDVTRVETESGFLAALQQGGIDLILADYALPSFDGLSALTITLRQRPDLPFIFVSGTMGEEVAVEALKIGATDYVLKTRLSRLVPSVRRALREANERAELRRAERELKDRGAKIRRLVEANIAGIFTWDLEGRILEANDAFLRIIGYQRDDLATGRLRWTDLTPPEWLKLDAQLRVPELKATGSLQPFEKEYFRKDGTRVPVLIGAATFNETGNQGVAFVLDLTERKRAEETLREQANLLSLTHDAIFVCDMNGMLKYWNPGAQELYGWTEEEAIGKVTHGLLRTIFPTPHSEIVSEVLRAGRWEGELVQTKKDGSQIVVASRWSLQSDERSSPVGYLETNNDITERKRAVSLLAGEKRVLEMVARGDSLAQILDALCRLVEEQASGVLTSILLLDGSRLRHGAAPSLPKAYTDAIDGAAIGPSGFSCGTAAYLGKQVVVEDTAIDPLWVNYRDLALAHSLRACWSTPVFSSQGKVIATFAMYYRAPRRPSQRDQEIIEQMSRLAGVAIEPKLTQELLRRSEAYLAEAQKLTLTGSCAIDGTNREIQYWSEEMFRLFGFDRQQGLPMWDQWVQRIHPEDRDKFRMAGDRTFLEKVDCDVEFRIVKPDGTVKHIHGIGHPVLSRNGELVQVVGTMVDVTERRRAEESLRRSESYLAEAQRLAHIGSWAFDALQKTPLYLSEEWCRLFGFDPKDGMPTWEQRLLRVHPDDLPLFQAAVDRATREKSELDVEFRILLPRSAVRYIRSVGHPVLGPSGEVTQFVGVTMDVTDSKQAEEERERLRRTQAELEHMRRVSTLGELTASLAHEIKQPIGAAVTNAEVCLRLLDRSQPDIAEAREAALEMAKDARRAADIIDRVRSLFQKSSSGPAVVDVNEVIEEMVVMLQNDAHRHSVTIHADLAGGLPQAMADRVQLQQVLMNLMLNGIEAMQGAGGELSVRSQLADDGQLLISVIDSGEGLPAESVDKIFDAFFTTKSQGTGLGLAITRSIVKSHGGRIWATGNSDRGTTFSFTLPSRVAVAA